MMQPTPEPSLIPVPNSQREGFVAGASASRCPDGHFHVWRYRKDQDGLGWYECACGTLLSKPSLKRLTDRA